MGNTAIVLISNAQFLEQIQVYLIKGGPLLLSLGTTPRQYHTDTLKLILSSFQWDVWDVWQDDAQMRRKTSWTLPVSMLETHIRTEPPKRTP